VNHPKPTRDDTLARLQILTNHLTERIEESEDARARVVQALKANAWPDIRSAVPHPLRNRRRTD